MITVARRKRHQYRGRLPGAWKSPFRGGRDGSHGWPVRRACSTASLISLRAAAASTAVSSAVIAASEGNSHSSVPSTWCSPVPSRYSPVCSPVCSSAYSPASSTSSASSGCPGAAAALSAGWLLSSRAARTAGSRSGTSPSRIRASSANISSVGCSTGSSSRSGPGNPGSGKSGSGSSGSKDSGVSKPRTGLLGRQLRQGLLLAERIGSVQQLFGRRVLALDVVPVVPAPVVKVLVFFVLTHRQSLHSARDSAAGRCAVTPGRPRAKRSRPIRPVRGDRRPPGRTRLPARPPG